eukprot:CAMPEP_0172312400 /NCGR_PEP_ID=MMETSP1058-20130122/17400_1 /TAXON_ID=83371 /ORGANISM="Detonula confervacea, Strain CCMP 353" /LENGTH=91 /DNA_ID=CAMNT_0013025843 /DNA_START=44 /DNA_END=320 /DNA_ORIENTATION=+
MGGNNLESKSLFPDILWKNSPMKMIGNNSSKNNLGNNNNGNNDTNYGSMPAIPSNNDTNSSSSSVDHDNFSYESSEYDEDEIEPNARSHLL